MPYNYAFNCLETLPLSYYVASYPHYRSNIQLCNIEIIKTSSLQKIKKTIKILTKYNIKICGYACSYR